MLPFSTFLLCSFFATISRPLLEAARIDGAGSWRIFWEIVLPLSVPALMTVVIVQALWVWNEVLIAVVFLQDQSLRTLMVGLTLFNSRYRLDVPVVMAGMLWATVPMVALYLLGQRFFIRGLTAGGGERMIDRRRTDNADRDSCDSKRRSSINRERNDEDEELKTAASSPDWPRRPRLQPLAPAALGRRASAAPMT